MAEKLEVARPFLMVLLAERLNLKAASEYNYLNQSNCLTIDRIDDVQKFQKLMVTPSVSCAFLCFQCSKCQNFVISYFVRDCFVIVGSFQHCSDSS